MSKDINHEGTKNTKVNNYMAITLFRIEAMTAVLSQVISKITQQLKTKPSYRHALSRYLF